MSASDPSSDIRIRLRLRGLVQGVGFRPFVYRAASELGLSGWVLNDPQGVLLEAQGPYTKVTAFVSTVTTAAPSPARVDAFEQTPCALSEGSLFAIVESDTRGSPSATILPELATCADCLRDIEDPENRRHGYAFTNCTHCGPRFTIIQSLPYDRPNTTMSGFRMCDECLREYCDPLDRRFHAQPNACSRCGPQLRLVNSAFEAVVEPRLALRAAAEQVRNGRIVAVQGLGGFHLLVDATNGRAVRALRERKHRWEKPLAVMVKSVEQALACVQLTAEEAVLLQSAEGPIVLCRKRSGIALSEAVAPDSPYLGVMLAATPLHHLLMNELNAPIVATSGNLSEEPICIDPKDATLRLGTIADVWLVHDRPIERHMDDSVVHVIEQTPQFLRRARGYAPLPVIVSTTGPVVLALGGHQKSTVALAVENRVFVSQHIGDLSSYETQRAFERVVFDFLRLYAATPAIIAHDSHKDYASTQFAERLTATGGPLEGVPRLAVQHHHAHLAACLADANYQGKALGVIWDGTGLGLDGTIWGGEFLYGDASGFQRVAAVKPYPLLGGEAAAREPRRSAFALLYGAFGAQIFDWNDLVCIAGTPKSERSLMKRILERQFGLLQTSSVGRLFDAVASLCGLVGSTSFEGRAGMLLESLCSTASLEPYPFPLLETPSPSPPAHTPRWLLDPSPMITAIVSDLRAGCRTEIIATRLHATLVASIVEVATRVGALTVALSGGCFQNRVLTERSLKALGAVHVRVLLHRQVPTNDGGLSLGQAVIARASAAKIIGSLE